MTPAPGVAKVVEFDGKCGRDVTCDEHKEYYVKLPSGLPLWSWPTHFTATTVAERLNGFITHIAEKAALCDRLAEALKAKIQMEGRGGVHKKLEDALCWKDNDEKAHKMATEALAAYDELKEKK